MPAKKKYVKKRKTTKPVQKSTIRKMVRQEINSEADTKYFDCKSLQSNLSFHRARSNVSAIGVRGFATCEDKNAQGTRIQYGVDPSSNAHQYLTELNMNRTFAEDASNSVAPNHVVGHYCNPSLAKSEFIMERKFLQTAGFGADYSTLRVAPYFVRVIRVAINAPKLSTINIDPENDLFMNELGQEKGIADSDFGPHELMMYIINKRKYKVIKDMKFELVPPFTSTDINTGVGTNALVTNLVSKGHMKRITMVHDIGTKLYFEAGGTTGDNSTAGQKNELILFHTCQIGVNSQADLLNNNALQVSLSGKFVSTFKDL